jgi:hypothetical protein
MQQLAEQLIAELATKASSFASEPKMSLHARAANSSN